MQNAVKSEETILRELVTDLVHIQDSSHLSEWEKDFLESVGRITNLKFLSEKQKTKILDMSDKYL